MQAIQSLVLAAAVGATMPRGASAGALLEYKRNSQSKLWMASTLLTRDRLEKAREYAAGGLYGEALTALQEAAGSCVGKGGVPESKYRCLYGIFERNVKGRANEYASGSDEDREKVGDECRLVMQKEVADLNRAYVTLSDAAEGSVEAQNKAESMVQAAISTNVEVEKSLFAVFNLPK